MVPTNRGSFNWPYFQQLIDKADIPAVVSSSAVSAENRIRVRSTELYYDGNDPTDPAFWIARKNLASCETISKRAIKTGGTLAEIARVINHSEGGC